MMWSDPSFLAAPACKGQTPKSSRRRCAEQPMRETSAARRNPARVMQTSGIVADSRNVEVRRYEPGSKVVAAAPQVRRQPTRERWQIYPWDTSSFDSGGGGGKCRVAPRTVSRIEPRDA